MTIGTHERGYLLPGGAAVASEAAPYPWSGRDVHSAPGRIALERAVVILTAAVILSAGLISPDFLSALKVHYISSGGSFYEKLHPSTYLVFLAVILLLMRNGRPVGEFGALVSGTKPFLVYFFACALLALQCVALKRPITAIIDTFVVPALLCLLIWSLSPSRRRALVAVVHVVIWVNIALAFYEYFSKHRLVPIAIGNAVVTGDWRSTALLGHPLTASGIVATYIMAMLLRPKIKLSPVIEYTAILIALCSLMVFGGRTALIAVLVVLAGIAIVRCTHLIRGARVRMVGVILAISGLMLVAAAVPVMVEAGTFDKMIDRFSSDNGSALARIASMQLMGLLDWKEWLLGTTPVRSGALQSMMGLTFGIEDFWLACIVQYGILQTALITIGLACFFGELLKRSAPGAYVTVLFLCVVAAGSVSFSSKNISLTVYVAIIALLLPRVSTIRPADVPYHYRTQRGIDRALSILAR